MIVIFLIFGAIAGIVVTPANYTKGLDVVMGILGACAGGSLLYSFNIHSAMFVSILSLMAAVGVIYFYRILESNFIFRV